MLVCGLSGSRLSSFVHVDVWRIYDNDELLAEVPCTASKPIARFNAREPEPPRQPAARATAIKVDDRGFL